MTQYVHYYTRGSYSKWNNRYVYIPPTATTTFNRFLTGRQRNFRVDSVVVIIVVVTVIVSLIRLILLYMYNALFRRTCQNNSIGKKVFFLDAMHTQRFIILLYTNPLRYSSLKSFRGGGKIQRKRRDGSDFNKTTTRHCCKINI